LTLPAGVAMGFRVLIGDWRLRGHRGANLQSAIVSESPIVNPQSAILQRLCPRRFDAWVENPPCASGLFQKKKFCARQGALPILITAAAGPCTGSRGSGPQKILRCHIDIRGDALPPSRAARGDGSSQREFAKEKRPPAPIVRVEL